MLSYKIPDKLVLGRIAWPRISKLRIAQCGSVAARLLSYWCDMVSGFTSDCYLYLPLTSSSFPKFLRFFLLSLLFSICLLFIFLRHSFLFWIQDKCNTVLTYSRLPTWWKIAGWEVEQAFPFFCVCLLSMIVQVWRKLVTQANLIPCQGKYVHKLLQS